MINTNCFQNRMCLMPSFIQPPTQNMMMYFGGFNLFNFFIILVSKSVLKDIQEHWTLLFVEFILLRYTVLKSDILTAVNNNKLC
jgi:hypothetical protein